MGYTFVKNDSLDLCLTPYKSGVYDGIYIHYKCNKSIMIKIIGIYKNEVFHSCDTFDGVYMY
jgi:hypothetical protein